MFPMYQVIYIQCLYVCIQDFTCVHSIIQHKTKYSKMRKENCANLSSTKVKSALKISIQNSGIYLLNSSAISRM